MGRVTLKCLVLGHDDRVRRLSGRMFLECAQCGRETSGWVVSDGRERAAERPALTRESDRRWPSVLRSPFSTAKMR